LEFAQQLRAPSIRLFSGEWVGNPEPQRAESKGRRINAAVAGPESSSPALKAPVLQLRE
jgi:hypothetical protein